MYESIKECLTERNFCDTVWIHKGASDLNKRTMSRLPERKVMLDE